MNVERDSNQLRGGAETDWTTSRRPGQNVTFARENRAATVDGESSTYLNRGLMYDLTLMQAQQAAMKMLTATSLGVMIVMCCDVEKKIQITNGCAILTSMR
jgi:hypothetical protein